MHFSSVLPVYLSAVYALSIRPPSSTLRVHEQIKQLPDGWGCHDDAEHDVPVKLRAYTRQSHRDYLEIAEQISSPSSARYGQHLSAEELLTVLPDTRPASRAIAAWLDQNGISEYEVTNEWVDFSTSVGRANLILNTTFSYCEYLDDEPVLRTQKYSLPVEMSEFIDFIYPTVHYFYPEKRATSHIAKRQHVPTGPANCSNSVCPAQIQAIYNISYRPKDNKSGSKIGIAGFLENFPNITDVKSFLTQYGINKKAPFPQYNAVSINGGTTKPPSDGGALTVEAELDLDYSVAFTGPLDVSFLSCGGRATQLSQPGNKTVSPSNNEPYLEFLQYILAQKTPPQVISISYTDDEQSVPPIYARRVCDLFAQVAARGISVIAASGDGGAASSGGDSTCKGPDGKRRFVPTFPASCPWITSVGATSGYGGPASFSSGGMSNYFDRPSWQDKNVTAYIKELNGTHKGFYNASGRGIPDVSLVGDDYLTLTRGTPGTHDGTSASAPVFAAMIALINDIRLRNNKPAVGFLNPLLYAANAHDVFRDVDDGNTSRGCADGDFFEPGWEALKGWDAATGLGEPDFQKLRALLC